MMNCSEISRQEFEDYLLSLGVVCHDTFPANCVASLDEFGTFTNKSKALLDLENKITNVVVEAESNDGFLVNLRRAVAGFSDAYIRSFPTIRNQDSTRSGKIVSRISLT